MPHTSTYALTNATLPYLVSLATLGVAEACRHDEALAAGRPSILLLPSSTPGRVFMARIQPRAVPDTTEFSSANSGLAEPVYEPSGFLGLSDEPVFARRPPQPAPPEHKKWWQRLRAS